MFKEAMRCISNVWAGAAGCYPPLPYLYHSRCNMARSRTKGGKKLDEFLRRAKTADGVDTVEIGFFSDAKYPDGTPVTNVAAYNEFGTNGKDGAGAIPERPFSAKPSRK